MVKWPDAGFFSSSALIRREHERRKSRSHESKLASSAVVAWFALWLQNDGPGETCQPAEARAPAAGRLPGRQPLPEAAARRAAVVTGERRERRGRPGGREPRGQRRPDAGGRRRIWCGGMGGAAGSDARPASRGLATSTKPVTRRVWRHTARFARCMARTARASTRSGARRTRYGDIPVLGPGLRRFIRQDSFIRH